VGPFGIRTTLLEPGMIRTSFHAAVQHAPALGADANNPATRRGDTRLADMPGGQAKVVAAMLQAAEAGDPPRRLLLGSDASTSGARGAGRTGWQPSRHKRRGRLHQRRRRPAGHGLSGDTRPQHRFDNTTVIVTGAAGALGSALVRRFADEGANVVDMSPGGDTDDIDAPEA
jgi:NAD(P)-dependent dehydrogenase (short-subunit alcohol dehydrogenase family)